MRSTKPIIIRPYLTGAFPNVRFRPRQKIKSPLALIASLKDMTEKLKAGRVDCLSPLKELFGIISERHDAFLEQKASRSGLDRTAYAQRLEDIEEESNESEDEVEDIIGIKDKGKA